jgi:YegS/Rv2252/BmrU family lipid kinase
VAREDVVFLVNPAAGNGSAGQRWAELAMLAADAGLRGDALLSEAPGHIGELALQAVLGGAQRLIVIGGDGTVNEAVNGVLAAGSTTVELAVVPRGTGDDFARSLGIPTRPEEALRIAAAGSLRTIDAGRASYQDWNGSPSERYFVNFAGAGISGAVARRGAATSRRMGAKPAYLWATVAVFLRWKSVPMEVELDDSTRSAVLYEVLVANGPYTAGGMRIAPDAVPDDGQFDTVLIGDFTKAEFAVTFPKIYRGTHVGHAKVEVVRARTVGVSAAEPLPVVLDGEQPGTTPARFEVLPGALRLRVPG